MKRGRVVRTAGFALAAGAVGAGVALLFAPHSGARTRKLIRRKAEDFGHGFRGVYKSVRDNGSGAARSIYRMTMKLTPRKAVERLAGS